MPYKSTDFDNFVKDIFQSQVNMLLKKNRLFNCDQKPTLGTVRFRPLDETEIRRTKLCLNDQTHVWK